MASIEEIRDGRLQKLQLLADKGIEAYPASATASLTNAEAVEKFETLKDNEPVTLVGRILSLRAQGKIIFITFDDGTARFQALLKSGEPLPEEDFELFQNAFDIGDFVEIRGVLFLTKREERTVLAESVRMLAKSLRPLPEKWHGLADTEERFRKRYLDLISNPEVKERFILRSKLITEIRRILDDAGYLEVETPALQPIYGGASAEPFVTHHNALDTDLYLRISDELYLKRLLAGGFPKVYEIARDFRNEGIDHTHNPEFTMLEFYEAYSDAPRQMQFVETMMKTLVKKLFNKDTVEWEGEVIDFESDFEVVRYFELLERYAGITNPATATEKDLREKALELGIELSPADSYYKVMDNIYKKACRPKLIQPTFIIDYPQDYLPLAKKKAGEEGIVEAFQLVIGGTELVKAFSELNDPIDQRSRFEAQEKFKEEGEKDAQILDEDFIEAMEHGIPPAGGVGIGIDRLAMLFTNTHNIKEVILFPTLRPKN
ncbi:MAG: lysyl-tRNA synthetase [Parcubacteria group bacterium]|nr:lysyl-tRNA synthetase [Parcubacteria group bacterium]